MIIDYYSLSIFTVYFQPFVCDALVVHLFFFKPILNKFRIITIGLRTCHIHLCNYRSPHAVSHYNNMLLWKCRQLI